MGTQITITTDDAALAADLISLINGGGTVPAASPTAAPAVKKAAPAAKKAAAKAPEPDPEPEVEEEDEDLVGGGSYTMADAVARATALVGEGRADDVKAALKEQKVKKVSELPDEDAINAFVTALED